MMTETQRIKQESAATLRAERARRGWTVEKAASLSGVSASSLKAYEHGARDMGFSNAVALADLYGISLDALVGRGAK